MEIACRAFVFRNNQVLLCKQNDPPRSFWALPGGSLCDGESLTNCLARELFEEIGMELEIRDLLYIREMIEPSRHRVEFYFLAGSHNDTLDKVIASNEVGEAAFFSITDLQSMIFKPNCLIDLLEEILMDKIHFPRYLGNVK